MEHKTEESSNSVSRNVMRFQAAREQVEAFNNLYPVGTLLRFKDDLDSSWVRRTSSKAWVLESGIAVVKFHDLPGCYRVDRVILMSKSKINDMGMSYYVPCDAEGGDLPD